MISMKLKHIQWRSRHFVVSRKWHPLSTLRASYILSEHNLWRHLAGPRAGTYWKHGEFALILSSVSLKMAIAPHKHGHPTIFSSHCNELITRMAWEKTNLISIAENWINKETRRYTVVFSILPFGNYIKTFSSNIRQNCIFLFKSNLRVCPRENQADVTHAISPISLKLSQMIKVIKLFKSPK